MSSAAEKQSIRQRMRAQRSAMEPARQASASAAVSAALDRLELLQSAGTIAGYRSVRGEINIDKVMARLIERGAAVTVPRVVGDDLEFVRWQPDATDRQGHFGIPEPVDGQVLDLARHDVVLAPLVAFDEHGQRLGQGKGFYDRCLAPLGHERPVIVGIAYAFQQVEQVPTQGWDVGLDAVVTDSRVVEFLPGALSPGNSANRPPLE